MEDKVVMVYGCTGYTGRYTVEDLVERGFKPIVAGRSACKVNAVAEELQLPARVFDVYDRAAAISALKGVDALLNCGGPFGEPLADLIEACIETSCHYLDIGGEVEMLKYCQERTRAAEEAKVSLIPAAGIDVVPSDCIAVALKEAMPDATELRVMINMEAGVSHGSAKTLLGLLPYNWHRVGGLETPARPLSDSVSVDYGDEVQTGHNITILDPYTSWISTGIPFIKSYVVLPPKQLLLVRLLCAVRPLLRCKSVLAILRGYIHWFIPQLTPEIEAQHISRLWGEARNARGEKVEARMITASGYVYTAYAICDTLEQVFKQNPRGGFYTPGQLMGRAYFDYGKGIKSVSFSDVGQGQGVYQIGEV